MVRDMLQLLICSCGSQLRVICFLEGHMAVSGDILLIATDMGIARDASKHFTVQRGAPAQKLKQLKMPIFLGLI